MKDKTETIRFRVSTQLLGKINRAVKNSVFSTKSDWLRFVIEEELKQFYIELDPKKASEPKCEL